MATAFILVGSIAGFLAAVLSYLVLDAHALVALAIWVLAGPLSAAIVMLASLPRPSASRAETVAVRLS